MALKSRRMEIPVELEKSYGLFLRRLIKGVQRIALASPEDRPRTDAANDELDDSDLSDEAIVALLALGFLVEDILDKDRLRRMLRTMAKGLDQRTKQGLTQLLGRRIAGGDTDEILDRWIDTQTALIEALLIQWAAEVGEDMIRNGITRAAAGSSMGRAVAAQSVARVQERGSRAERRAFQAASQSILALNAQVVGANAQAAGVGDYIWRTSALSPSGAPDAKTREWHLDLDGTAQRFDNPPLGGGTLAEDPGNPQEGINCRCIAEIFTAT